MNKLILFLILGFCFSAIHAQVNLNDRLVAYYPFNGNANDSTSNGLDGVVSGATLVPDRLGNSNAAYSFNGSGDVIGISHDPKLNLTRDKTISVWYKIATTAGLTGYPSLVYKIGVAGFSTFSISLAEHTGYPAGRRFRLNFSEGVNSTFIAETFSKESYQNYVSQWVHIVGTYSYSDMYMRIYFNGKISDSSYVGKVTSDSSTSDMYFGRGVSPASSNYFKEIIDDVRLYSRAITATEIKALFEEGTRASIFYVKDSVCFNDSFELGFFKPKTKLSDTMIFQLSDSSGRFSTPYNLGTFNDSNEVKMTVKFKLPNHFATSSNYKIRIVTRGINDTADGYNNFTFYQNPKATFVLNDSTRCLPAAQFAFSGNASSTSAVSYHWDFGNGDTSSQKNVQKSYTQSGTYDVSLKVTTSNNCTDSFSSRVFVYDAPVASFSTNDTTTCFNNHQFVFNSTSTIPDNSALTYSWKLGDQDTSTQAYVAKTYQQTGEYTVKLVVTSKNECTDSISQKVVVYANPQASFVINDTNQCLYDNFMFTSTSTIAGNSTLKHAWELGDQDTSTLVNLTKTYQQAGEYVVKLVAISNHECKDSITRKVVVNLLPQASFSINDYIQCLRNNNVQFTNTSTIADNSTLATTWNFGDNNGSSSFHKSYQYSSSDTFEVQLIMTSAAGCKDTATQQVIINPEPAETPSFTSVPANCQGDTGSIHANLSPILYDFQWLKDGAILASDTTEDVRIYRNGTYSLIVTNSYGCADTTTALNLQLNPLPAKPKLKKVLNQLDADTGYYKYQWYKNSASLPNDTGRFYTMIQNGIYYVRVENMFGCENWSDTINMNNLGIQHATESGFDIYPNPAKDKLMVKGNHISFIRLYDVQGKLLYEYSEIKADDYVIDLTGIRPGTIIIETGNADVLIRKKIIVL